MISFPKIALDENLKSDYLDFAPVGRYCFGAGVKPLGREHVRIYRMDTAEKGQMNQHVRGDCGKVSRS